MKRLAVSIATILLMANTSFAQAFGPYSLKTNLPADDCMARIDEWVALNLGSYTMNVDYRNPQTGRTIIKGTYQPEESVIYAVNRNAVRTTIEYTIITEAKDNECLLTFNSLYYCFRSGGYVDYNRLGTRTIEVMADEMRFIEELGEKIEITPAFFDKAASFVDEYDAVSDKLNDDSLKKSEKKKISSKRDDMLGKKNVYQDASLNSAEFMQMVTTSFERALK